MTDQLTWRQATQKDEAFLLALFATHKRADFAPFGFSSRELEPLIAMQFRARQLGYAQTNPAAIDMILCRTDGTALGRHLVERQPHAYRGIDLAILPEFQNQGIGAWALRQVQRLAAAENLPFRLRVLRSNPALNLFKRLGFLCASGDDIAYEMEWQARALASQAHVERAISPELAQHDEASLGREEILGQILSFVREIGLLIQFGRVPSSTSVPGIQIISNGLRVDLDHVLYPGDLLHTAGHLGVLPPERRAAEFPKLENPAEEMAALAWSYAAAVHLDLPPQVVFHEHGYRGQSDVLISAYQAGNGVGLPVLGWMGLTTQTFPHRTSIFPKMRRWLRVDPILDTLGGGDAEQVCPGGVSAV